jgi:hypothetical protein
MTGMRARRNEIVSDRMAAFLYRFLKVVAASRITTAEMMGWKTLITGTARGSGRDRYELYAQA